MTWLENDDEVSRAHRALWAKRVTQPREAAKEVEYEEIDVVFHERVATLRAYFISLKGKPLSAEREQVTAVRQRSADDAINRPWLKAEILFPMRAETDNDALAALIASLDTHVLWRKP